MHFNSLSQVASLHSPIDQSLKKRVSGCCIRSDKFNLFFKERTI